MISIGSSKSLLSTSESARWKLNTAMESVGVVWPRWIVIQRRDHDRFVALRSSSSLKKKEKENKNKTGLSLHSQIKNSFIIFFSHYTGTRRWRSTLYSSGPFQFGFVIVVVIDFGSFNLTTTATSFNSKTKLHEYRRYCNIRRSVGYVLERVWVWSIAGSRT